MNNDGPPVPPAKVIGAYEALKTAIVEAGGDEALALDMLSWPFDRVLLTLARNSITFKYEEPGK